MEIMLAGFEGYCYQCKQQGHKADARVQIKSHQLMAEEPLALEEEPKEKDVEVKAELDSKESSETVASKATWNETAPG
jgi:hypothetical protein